MLVKASNPNLLNVIFAPDSPMRRSMQAGWRMLALRYVVMANTVYRPAVYRHLTALLPLDEHTFAVFTTLRNAKPGF
ncbi:MAG TPA: hypothetical protein GX400_03005 [Chloroflexi bacterium]|nr:hypothetical protein [Chloroflexota bacterium]